MFKQVNHKTNDIHIRLASQETHDTHRRVASHYKNDNHVASANHIDSDTPKKIGSHDNYDTHFSIASHINNDTHISNANHKRLATKPKTKEKKMKTMFSRIKGVILTTMLFGFAANLLGCASIMHGTSQDVPVNSSPDGAKISNNGMFIGTTPAVVKLKRGDSQTILRIEKDGYEPANTMVTNEMSGWIFGNVLFGGVIGLGVDFIDGAAYNLNPSNVNVQLQKKDKSVAVK